MNDSHILKFDYLGELVVERTLLFYDYPKIFVCRDKVNGLHFFYESYSDAQMISWISLAITTNRYFDILENRISLREILLTPEKGLYYKFTEYSDGVTKTEVLDKLEYFDLPRGDTFIGLEINDDAIYDDYMRELVSDSINQQKSIVEIHTYKYSDGKMPLSQMNDINNVMESRLKQYQHDYKAFTGTKRGSCILYYEITKKFNELINNDLSTPINHVKEIFDINASLDNVIKNDSDLTRMKNFYKSLKEFSTISGLDIRFSTPKPEEYISKKISIDELDIFHKRVENFVVQVKETDTIKTDLVGIDVSKKRMWIKYKENYLSISYEKINPNIPVFKIPSTYEFKFEYEITNIDSKPKNAQLLSIRELV
jgi:hypothetical protein